MIQFIPTSLRHNLNFALPPTKPMTMATSHNAAIVDGTTLVSGSFNWTRQGVLYNNENVIIQCDTQLLASFQGEFERLWDRFRLSSI